MKSFLEEYGFAILAAIVVIILIAMSSPVGSLIKEQIFSIISNLVGEVNHKINNLNNDEKQLITKQAVGNNDILIQLTSDSISDTFKLQYRIKNSSGWTGWNELASYNKIVGDGKQFSINIKDNNINIKNKEIIEFQAVDNATGIILSSASFEFNNYEPESSQIKYISITLVDDKNGKIVSYENIEEGKTWADFIERLNKELPTTDLEELAGKIKLINKGSWIEDVYGAKLYIDSTGKTLILPSDIIQEGTIGRLLIR